MKALKLGLLMAVLALPGPRPAAGDDIPTTGNDTAALVESNNRFAVELYARLRARKGNLCASPFSLATGLTVIADGARGDTAAELARVLHQPADPSTVRRAYRSLLDGLSSPAGPRGTHLNSANSLWGKKGIDFLPEYVASIKKSYRSNAAEADFAGDPEAARRAINAWVKEQTAGKLTNLLKTGDVDHATQLVLVDVLAFRGNWTSPFKKELTAPGAFRASEGETVQVPFMNQTGMFRTGDSKSGRALELPYIGHDITLVVLLPHKNEGLAALEDQLSGPSLAEWLRGLKTERVALSLPRFAMSAELHLNETLTGMGMPLAFHAGKADFSGLCSSREPFALTDVTQQVSIEVDESGTEALAATVIRSARGLPGPEELEFRADHPFVLLLRDQRSGAILFMGRYSDPRS